MAKKEPFEKHASEYDSWFEENRFVYESELRVIQEQIPKKGEGLEIGVGSGRFAAPLGIRFGLEPSARMRDFARSRGIIVIGGIAERLPFRDRCFDFILMVTTLCFLDDVEFSFKETFRVLKPRGHFIIGFIDKNSPVGKVYQQQKYGSRFYKEAIFYSVGDVISFLGKAGFQKPKFKQTIFQKLHLIESLEPIKAGYGEGSFVTVKAVKPKK